MIGKAAWFLLLGVIWLFIFSIPVNKEQRVFDIGFNLIVDTKPINWAVTEVQHYIDLTKGAGEKKPPMFSSNTGGRRTSL